MIAAATLDDGMLIAVGFGAVALVWLFVASWLLGFVAFVKRMLG